MATCQSFLLSTEEALFLPLAVFGSFGGTSSLQGTNYPSLTTSLSFFLFFRLASVKGLTERGGGRGGGGSWAPEASLGADPLALLARSSWRPLFLSSGISSSSSSSSSSSFSSSSFELLVMCATMNQKAQMLEDLSILSFEFET